MSGNIGGGKVSETALEDVFAVSGGYCGMWESEDTDAVRTSHIIQIKIDSTIMKHQEIPHAVHSLHWVSVAIVGINKPGKVRFYKFPRRLFRPKL